MALNFRTACDLGRPSTWSERPVSQARKLKLKGGPRRVIQPVRSRIRSGPGGEAGHSRPWGGGVPWEPGDASDRGFYEKELPRWF